MDGVDPLHHAKLRNVRTEMVLNVLAYNIKRMISILDLRHLMRDGSRRLNSGRANYLVILSSRRRQR